MAQAPGSTSAPEEWGTLYFLSSQGTDPSHLGLAGLLLLMILHFVLFLAYAADFLVFEW